jgi:hypothetical protein
MKIKIAISGVVRCVLHSSRFQTVTPAEGMSCALLQRQVPWKLYDPVLLQHRIFRKHAIDAATNRTVLALARAVVQKKTTCTRSLTEVADSRMLSAAAASVGRASIIMKSEIERRRHRRAAKVLGRLVFTIVGPLTLSLVFAAYSPPTHAVTITVFGTPGTPGVAGAPGASCLLIFDTDTPSLRCYHYFQSGGQRRSGALS